MAHLVLFLIRLFFANAKKRPVYYESSDAPHDVSHAGLGETERVASSSRPYPGT